MLRLKSRTQSPPGGFLYEQRQTGFQSWKVDPPSQWDFNRLCQVVREHRMANPQFRLNTNLGVIQNEMDMVNASRVAAIPGAGIYLVDDNAASFTPPPQTKGKLLNVAEKVRKLSVGDDVLEDWEKSGDPPVAKDQAEARALVCSMCPLNGKGDFTRYFTIPLANTIRKRIERMFGMGLKTSLDEKLGVCEGCLCPLKLKVWAPTKHILEHLTPEIERDLSPANPVCWVLEEKAAHEKPS